MTLKVLVLAVLVAVACSEPSEGEQFDIALRDNLDPDPTHEEVVETCAAMEQVNWHYTTLWEQPSVRQRVKAIASVIENARWEQVSGSGSDLAWERYHNREECMLYCSEKRKRGS